VIIRGSENSLKELNATFFLKKKTRGNKSFKRLRHTWEDNIKIEIKEEACGKVNLFELAEGKIF
jgi:hypothetical protein